MIYRAGANAQLAVASMLHSLQAFALISSYIPTHTSIHILSDQPIRRVEHHADVDVL
jgi:hypothetical protein